jgi:hypothetical protein
MAVLPVSYWAILVEKKPSHANPCPLPASQYRVAGNLLGYPPPLVSRHYHWALVRLIQLHIHQDDPLMGTATGLLPPASRSTLVQSLVRRG